MRPGAACGLLPVVLTYDGRRTMGGTEIAFLGMTLAAFALFMATLAWSSATSGRR